MVATIEDARGNVTEMEYDGFDRPDTRTYPDTTFEQMTYNDNSQVMTMLTRKGDTITNIYDVLNRLSTRDPGPLPLQTMTYDLAGRVLNINTPTVGGDPSSGDYGFTFDTAGRPLTQTMPNAAEVAYQLDENGNRIKLTWPDAFYANYAFDKLNRLTDITLNDDAEASIHFDYDDLSRRTGITYINGAACTYSYSQNNDLTLLEHAFVGSSVNFAYSFNHVHQVIQQTASDSEYMWKPSTFGVTSYAAANDLNQYPSVGSTGYGYDDNGNLTSGPLSASFDALNRLTQAISGGTTNNYWNDPLNRQAQKEVDSAKTGYLFDGLQLIAEYDDTPALVNRYIPGAGLDEILIQISGTDTTTFLHKDRLRSVVAQTNDSGAVLNKYSYSPFGETPSLTGTIFGFTGQRYDAEIGLYNYKARYYAPAVGRFLQPDPLGYAAGDMNLYGYVGNGPINWTDRTGLLRDDYMTVPIDPAKQMGYRFVDKNLTGNHPLQLQALLLTFIASLFTGATDS